jgi:hypothetical protein
MCDTPTDTKLKLAEERETYITQWNVTLLNLTANGIHLPVGSKVWAEFATIWDNVAREDSKIEFIPDGCSFRVNLLN